MSESEFEGAIVAPARYRVVYRGIAAGHDRSEVLARVAALCNTTIDGIAPLFEAPGAAVAWDVDLATAARWVSTLTRLGCDCACVPDSIVYTETTPVGHHPTLPQLSSAPASSAPIELAAKPQRESRAMRWVAVLSIIVAAGAMAVWWTPQSLPGWAQALLGHRSTVPFSEPRPAEATARDAPPIAAAPRAIRGEIDVTAELERVEALRGAAERGDVQAQFDLAVALLESRLIPHDETDAIRWLRAAAKLGHGGAQAKLVALGIDAPVSDGATQSAARKVGDAEKGSEDTGETPPEPIEMVKSAAESGDAQAQYNYSQRLLEGIGVAKNAAEAATWLRTAAEGHHADAQLALGHALVNGNGVERNEAEAVEWFRKAAERGSAEAQFQLGQALAKGSGTTQNLGESLQWMRQAADKGNAAAQLALGDALATGDAANPNEALQWYRRAAQLGLSEAEQKARSLESSIQFNSGFGAGFLPISVR